MSKRKYDKFHLTAQRLGWNNFTLSVVEICKLSDLVARENYYLYTYKPLLNSVFRSYYSASVYKKVSGLKTLRALLLRRKKLHLGEVAGIQLAKRIKGVYLKEKPRFPVWVYKLTEGSIDPNFTKYSNRQLASNAYPPPRPPKKVLVVRGPGFYFLVLRTK